MKSFIRAALFAVTLFLVPAWAHAFTGVTFGWDAEGMAASDHFVASTLDILKIQSPVSHFEFDSHAALIALTFTLLLHPPTFYVIAFVNAREWHYRPVIVHSGLSPPTQALGLNV